MAQVYHNCKNYKIKYPLKLLGMGKGSSLNGNGANFREVSNNDYGEDFPNILNRICQEECRNPKPLPKCGCSKGCPQKLNGDTTETCGRECQTRSCSKGGETCKGCCGRCTKGCTKLEQPSICPYGGPNACPYANLQRAFKDLKISNRNGKMKTSINYEKGNKAKTSVNLFVNEINLVVGKPLNLSENFQKSDAKTEESPEACYCPEEETPVDHTGNLQPLLDYLTNTLTVLDKISYSVGARGLLQDFCSKYRSHINLLRKGNFQDMESICNSCNCELEKLKSNDEQTQRFQ